MDIKKSFPEFPSASRSHRRRDRGEGTARASSRGPPADRPVLGPDVPGPRPAEPMRLSTTVNLPLRSSRTVSAGMRKSERGWRVRGGRVAGAGPARPPLARVWLTLLAGPRSASLRLWLPLRGGAGLGAGEGRGSGRPEPERVRVRGGPAWVRAGRQARGLAGPVSAAPCPQRGRRERRARGCGAAASPPSRPRLLRPGLRWALGAGPATGRRPRAAAAAARPDRREGQGKLSARRRAAPVAKPPLPAPARWCTSLSFSLAHSLTSWLEIPTDVERRQTDGHTRARRGGGRWGRRRGWGKPALLWGRATPARPRLPARRAPPEPLWGAGEGRALGGQDAGVPRRRSRSPEGRSGRGRLLQAPEGPSLPEKREARRRRPCGCPELSGPEPLRTGPSIWRDDGSAWGQACCV